MKRTSSRPRLSATRTSLNIMFFLLMIVYSPCAWPALALAADSEPMVSLPGGVPPRPPNCWLLPPRRLPACRFV